MVRLVSSCCIALVCALSGCCCVPHNGTAVGTGACCGTCAPPIDSCGCGGGCDNCLPTLQGLANLASCKGACGEVYIDERINEPPCDDQCGFSDCGGCGQCRNCRPLLTTLRLLWGTPYATCCDTGFGCDSGGCSSCDGGYVGDAYSPASNGAGCNCGGQHSGDVSMPQMLPAEHLPSQPMMESTPVPSDAAGGTTSRTPTPTPAPAITPSSARRINPAAQRRASRQAPIYR